MGSVINAIMFSSRDALLDALMKGGSPNEIEDGKSALIWACYQDRGDFAEDLIRHGANVEICEADGTTPLFIAASAGNAVVVKMLIQAGATTDAVNEIGQTPLMAAAKSGSGNTVSALLEAGANPTQKDTADRNALHWAAIGGDFPEIVVLLVKAGSSALERSTDGQSAFDYALALKRDSMAAILGMDN